ncbi:MAG: hypothetical protein J6Y36_09640 [Treponema sp.]|nr:hypothetical protein [Treponema sp.]
MMKALLDTNIIIHRENTKVTNKSIGILYYWLDKLNYEKCIHPYTVQELRKFKDQNLQELYDAKLSSYTELKTIAHENISFLEKLPNPKNGNDRIDNQLLCEVYNNRVDILITEDRKLREKGGLLSIKNKIFSIDEFVRKCTNEYPDLISYKMLAVQKELFGNIDLSDPFFDTFKNAYPGFINWFNSKCNEEAYVCRTDSSNILGFLYLKTEEPNENYSDISPVFSPKKRLKIGTFKVESSGFRLGERFIKIIFDNALLRNVDEIYVTLFEDRPELKALESLFEAWGFIRYGKKTSFGKEEVVYTKELKSYFHSKSIKENFPNIIYNRKQKFIVPIYPQFHTTLLPDSKLNTEDKIDFIENIPHRYALQKIYISWCGERNINPGDFVLFYRMGEEGSNKKYTSVLTSLCIIDSVKYNFRNKDEFLNLCNNRSVFSKSELDSFWTYHSFKLLVVKFIFVKSLEKRLTLDYLQQTEIIEPLKGPRPFTRLTDVQFDQILHDSKTDINFIKE